MRIWFLTTFYLSQAFLWAPQFRRKEVSLRSSEAANGFSIASTTIPFSGPIPSNVVHTSSSYSLERNPPSPLQDLISELRYRLDKIDNKLDDLGTKVSTLSKDVSDVKRRMGNSSITEAIAERFGESFAPELHVKCLDDLLALVPSGVAEDPAKVVAHRLEPMVEPCARAVLELVHTRWKSQIEGKLKELSPEEAERLQQAVQIAFASVPVTSWPKPPAKLYNSNPRTGSQSQQIQLASRLIALDTIADITGNRRYLSGFCPVKSLTQSFLNYFDRTCDLRSPIGPGLTVLLMVAACGVGTNKNQIPLSEFVLDLPGKIHVVATPEEFRDRLPNSHFCLMKTGVVDDPQKLSLHLQVLQIVMGMLLTKGQVVDGIPVEQVDYVRQGVLVRVGGGGPTRERSYWSPDDLKFMTSVVELTV